MKKILIRTAFPVLMLIMASCGTGNAQATAAEVAAVNEMANIINELVPDLGTQIVENMPNSVAIDDTATEPAQSEPEPEPIEEEAPGFEPLNLPITMTEQTMDTHWYIAENGDLIRIVQNREEVIATGVRSLYNHSGTFFHITENNDLYGWGSNTQGRLGDGTGVDRDTPVHILDNVAKVGRGHGRAGTIHARDMWAIQTDGTFLTWGWNIFYPTVQTEGIVAYLRALYVLRYDGIVINYRSGAVWADSPIYAGEFSRGGPEVFCYITINSDRRLSWTTFDTLSRQRMRGGPMGDDVVAINTAYSGSYGRLPSFHFISEDGTLWGFGSNHQGTLGDGTVVPRTEEPVKIAESVASVGSYGFLTTNGELWTWNRNNPMPEMVRDDVVRIGTMLSHTTSYAVTEGGEIYVGNDLYAAMNARPTQRSRPIRIPQTITFQ